MRHALSDPTPRTDPPDDDPEGIEAAREADDVGWRPNFAAKRWHHECEDGEPCPPCVACYLAHNVTVCQFTCEHRRDME